MTTSLSDSMPHKHHRVSLAKLKAKLDKLRVKIKGEKPVSPFVVVRLGSGRVQTKALRVGNIFSDVQPCLCSTRGIEHCSRCLDLHSEPAIQDCGCDANWSGSYHIDDVDPNAAQDLEVFVYDAATDGRELIGK